MSFVVIDTRAGEQRKFDQYHDAWAWINESFSQWNAFHSNVAFGIVAYKVPDENVLEVNVSDEIGISESLGP